MSDASVPPSLLSIPSPSRSSTSTVGALNMSWWPVSTSSSPAVSPTTPSPTRSRPFRAKLPTPLEPPLPGPLPFRPKPPKPSLLGPLPPKPNPPRPPLLRPPPSPPAPRPHPPAWTLLFGSVPRPPVSMIPGRSSVSIRPSSSTRGCISIPTMV